MTGVSWRPLPADAPEPEAMLTVVRQRTGHWWIHTSEGSWSRIGDGRYAEWELLVENHGPLEVAERPGDEYAPWSPPPAYRIEDVELDDAPSDYEVRERALGHAVHFALPSGYMDAESDGIVSDETVELAASIAVRMAQEFEPYLRTGGQLERATGIVRGHDTDPAAAKPGDQQVGGVVHRFSCDAEHELGTICNANRNTP